MGPPMAPAVVYRPPCRTTSSSGAKSGPPTTSASTSTRPSAASATAAARSSDARSTQTSAPSAVNASNLAALVTATTRAPRSLASCTSAEPTPPDAPVTTTVSAGPTAGRVSMCSAVAHEHGKDASSTSVRSNFEPLAGSIGYTFRSGMAQYWAYPPSRSDPR